VDGQSVIHSSQAAGFGVAADPQTLVACLPNCHMCSCDS
jgi:hypothetical protein